MLKDTNFKKAICCFLTVLSCRDKIISNYEYRFLRLTEYVENHGGTESVALCQLADRLGAFSCMG